MNERRINIGTKQDTAQRASNASRQAAAFQNRASGSVDLPRFSYLRYNEQEIDDDTLTIVEFNAEETNFTNDSVDFTTSPATRLKFITSDITGLWAITAGVHFASDNNGLRSIRMNKRPNAPDEAIIPQSRQRVDATGLGAVFVQSSFMATIQENDEIALFCYQDSGSALDVTFAWLQGFRIGA